MESSNSESNSGSNSDPNYNKEENERETRLKSARREGEPGKERAFVSGSSSKDAATAARAYDMLINPRPGTSTGSKRRARSIQPQGAAAAGGGGGGGQLGPSLSAGAAPLHFGASPPLGAAAAAAGGRGSRRGAAPAAAARPPPPFGAAAALPPSSFGAAAARPPPLFGAAAALPPSPFGAAAAGGGMKSMLLEQEKPSSSGGAAAASPFGSASSFLSGSFAPLGGDGGGGKGKAAPAAAASLFGSAAASSPLGAAAGGRGSRRGAMLAAAAMPPSLAKAPFGGGEGGSGAPAATSGGRMALMYDGNSGSRGGPTAALASSGGLGISASPFGSATAAPFGGAAFGGGGGGSGAAAAAAAAAAAPPPCGIAQCHHNHPIHNMTLIQCLALSLADNLHDMAGGYRNKTPAEAHEARVALMNTFYRTFTLDRHRDVVIRPGDALTLGQLAVRCRERADVNVNANITDCLHTLMDDRVTLSNIEDSTIAFFERTVDYLHPLLPTSKVTYDEIIADADAAIIGRAQRDRQNGSFQILPGTRRSKTLTHEEKQKIALYKNVFFTGSDIADINVTFDAGKGAVGHIYEGHEFVRGLNMPQNVGDSATTSFKKLGAQPDLYIAPKTDGNKFYVKRNILSNDQLRIFYQDDGFSSKFPFKISFGLEAVGGAAAAPPDTVSMSYEQNGYTQGPSLDYLIELMRAAQTVGSNFSTIETTSLCLRIGDAIQRNATINGIVRAIQGAVYPDGKRGGDADVPDAALLQLCESFIDENKYIIAATIDRLCSLVYRLLGIPCIYHNGDELILYINLQTDRSIDVDVKAGLLAAKQQAYIDNYSGLVNLYKNVAAQANLLRFICSFRNVNIIPELITSPPATAADAAAAAAAAAALTPLQILKRNKFVDIYNRLRDVYTIITRVVGDDVRPEDVIEAINIVPPAAAAAAAAAAPASDSDQVKARKIDKFFAIFSAAEIDKSFLIGLQAILAAPAAAGGAGEAGPAAPPGNSRFIPTVDYGYLNYSIEAFENLEKAYNEFMRIINPARRLREPENYDNKLNKEDGYNTLLRKYTNTFFDVGHGNTAYDDLMFKTPAPAAGAGDPASDHRAAIAAYERDAKVVASLIGETPAIQARRRAFGATKATAITASQELRGMFTNLPLARLDATVLPDGCLAQGGGAYQKGGAYSEDHVKIFKDICERAATFINSEIGRLYPLAILRFAVDQFVEALELWKAAGANARLRSIRSTYVNNSHTFIRTAIQQVVIARDAAADAAAAAGDGDARDAAAAAAAALNAAIEAISPYARDADIAVITASADAIIPHLKAGGPVPAGAATNPIDQLLNVDVTIDNLLLGIPDSRASDMLTELFMIWTAGINGGAVDDSYDAISVLLDPYDTPNEPAAAAAAEEARIVTAVAAAARVEAAEALIVGSQNQIFLSKLKIAYPLLFSSARDSPNRQRFLKKLVGSDRFRGIYNRVSLYSLITLAFFDDLFKGNVGNRTSLLISRLGELPAQAREFDITTEAQWNRIPEIITNILIQVNNNRISTEGLVLMTGGARSSKYRHTRRRNRRAKRVTRRKD